MSEILIIGGGVIGMLTARELAMAGASVSLVERQRAGQESSWAGGGIISPLYPWRYPQPVSVLADWSQRHYSALSFQLAADTGIDPQWTQNGLLIMVPEEQPQALAWGERQKQQVEIVDRSMICRLEPPLADPPATGIWLPQVAQVRNPRLVKALRADLLRRNVSLREQTDVEKIEVRQDRVCGVITNRGRIRCDHLLVCAGAWSGRLLQGLGVSLAVKPVRGQMILFNTPAGTLSRIVLRDDRYAIPRRDGRVLFGSTLEHVGFDRQTTRQAYDELLSVARSMFPILSKAPVERHWAGLRPGSPDGVPFIGQHPRIQGLHINSGHFRNGVVLAPASARLMADLLLHRTPAVAAAPYRIDRGETT